MSEDVTIGNDFESQIDLEVADWAKEQEAQGGTSGFFAAVSRYYAQFLDTDFKKSRLPKRRLENKDRKGRRVGVPLKRYPGFEGKAWKSLQSQVSDGYKFTIPKGVFTASLPSTTLSAVRGQIRALSQEDFSQPVDSLFASAKGELARKPDTEIFRENFFETLRKILARTTVGPLLSRLDSFFDSASSPVDRIIQLEDELSNFLLGPVVDNSSDAVTTYIVDQDDSALREVFNDYLSTEALQSRLNEFFDDFSAGDLFVDIREMLAVEQLAENVEFYLHVGEIHYKNNVFPLFYLPLDVQMDGAVIGLTSEPHLYVNKKALDYISDDLKRADATHTPSIIKDRIYYLESSELVVNKIEQVISPVMLSMSLSGDVDFRTTRFSEAKSGSVRMNNRLSISLFDQSDESMVNDYEALLTGLAGGGEVVGFFEELVDQFLVDNPVSIHKEISEGWENTSVSDRLVFDTPLPLAEEQRKILSSLNNPKSRFVLVEGPPGTGKSHTIAAIAFNFILSGKNLLVLSDKKEALDVVETFLNNVLSQVRTEDDFQNPILRLGKSKSNFSKLIRPATIQKIETNVRVAKSKQKKLGSEHDSLVSSLKNDIKKTSESFEEVSIEKIRRYHEEELQLMDDYPELEEAFDEEEELELINDLATVRDYTRSQGNRFAEIFDKFGVDLENFLFIAKLNHAIQSIKIGEETAKVFKAMTSEGVETLRQTVDDVTKAKGVLGYLFAGSKIRPVASRLKTEFNVDLHPVKQIGLIRDALQAGNEILQALDNHRIEREHFSDAYYVLIRGGLEPISPAVTKAAETVLSEVNSQNFPLEIEDDLRSILVDEDTDMTRFLKRAVDLRTQRKEITIAFDKAPQLDYLGDKTKVESLNAQKLANVIDERVISFYHENHADAKTLAKIIKDKSKFPIDKFEVLQKAFPCMIAGLRDYAEFIPLKKDLFDLVIIDEGSQVSIAQAWPAVLRAKKMVVLGDRRQFANVKTSNASKEINSAYMKHVLEEFNEQFPDADPSAKERAKIFNIKSSVMDFFEMVSNYQIQLRKHFRSYPELISFSSKYFYEESLQPLKIRGKPITDVIEFRPIDHDGLLDLTRNTNQLEADAIIEELVSMLDAEEPLSAAVITPHTEQQTLISRLVTDHERGDEFRKQLQLRIFTFDTCQGEERDVILYSLVATKEKDRLGGIFLRSIEKFDDDEVDGSIRLQRLNVGFSRAKEKIMIFHSKPIEEFTNSIKTALQHYTRVLQNSKDMPSADDVDPNSPKEAELLQWLRATPFIQELLAGEGVEILPGFEIGKYLKTLDPNYTHPNYRVDFLVRVVDGDKSHNLIIEYDGFQYHFVSDSGIDAGNWELYLTENDVEREKTLESFGYKMLRVNRFNLGQDPVVTLDNRLRKLLDDLVKGKRPAEIVSQITATSASEQESLKAKTHRLCSKCGELRPNESFVNRENKSGKSRFCNKCRDRQAGSTKGKKSLRPKSTRIASDKEKADLSKKAPNCPNGHGALILRSGKYGLFYGCTQFPRCRKTARIRY